jgi:hypothetical protein
MTLHSIGQIEKGKEYSSTYYYCRCGITLQDGTIQNYSISRSKLRDLKSILANINIGMTISGLEYSSGYWLRSPFCNL